LFCYALSFLAPKEEAPVVPEEPEDTSVTYEEFLATQVTLEEDQREARTVENDDKVFKGKEIAKEEFSFQLDGMGVGTSKAKKNKKGPAKKRLGLDEFAAKGQTNGRGRGRGRGRGGGRGKGYRPPSLNDQHFPKLG